MNQLRKVVNTFKSKDTLEGAGVRLKRGFSNLEAPQLDPFLLFDDFSSTVPEHYLSGFPWHPHRGMETVTYILNGAVRHKDSLGNAGVITDGAVQWMTAGSGIVHEEMPESVNGIRGFQLWVNLPKAQKMSPPRYQDLTSAVVPVISLAPLAHARLIAGSLANVTGPLESIAGAEIFKEQGDYKNPSVVASSQAAKPLYVDLTLESNGSVDVPVEIGHTAFIYIIDGAVGAGSSEEALYGEGTILLFDRKGDTISLSTGSTGARFLLIAGAPLNEPIAWHGPIVMNTDEELRQAFTELREGTFIR